MPLPRLTLLARLLLRLFLPPLLLRPSLPVPFRSHFSTLYPLPFLTPSSRRPRPGPSSNQTSQAHRALPGSQHPRRLMPPNPLATQPDHMLPTSYARTHSSALAPLPFPATPTRQKNPPKLSLASRPPLGAGWPETVPPFTPIQIPPPGTRPQPRPIPAPGSPRRPRLALSTSQDLTHPRHTPSPGPGANPPSSLFPLPSPLPPQPRQNAPRFASRVF